MGNPGLNMLKILILRVPAMVISPFYRSLKDLIELFAVDVNPFSRRRKGPAISRRVRYTRDVLIGEDFEIGEYTYGIPTVLKNPGMKVRIGKFCSFAPGLILELRGKHTVDFVTTYP